MCTYARRCESGGDFELSEAELPCHLRDLFLGPPGESGEQRAARLTAARDVLAEWLEEGEADDIARQDAMYAVRLGGAALLRVNCRALQPIWRGRAV